MPRCEREPRPSSLETAQRRRAVSRSASAGVVFDGDEGRLSEEAFLRDFAGDLPEAKAKVLYAVQGLIVRSSVETA
jgi:hypothetical protein